MNSAGVVVIQPGGDVLGHGYAAAGRQAGQGTIRLGSPQRLGTRKPTRQPGERTAGGHGPGDGSPLITGRVDPDTCSWHAGGDLLEVSDHSFKVSPVEVRTGLPAVTSFHIQPPEVIPRVRHAANSGVVVSLRIAIRVRASEIDFMGAGSIRIGPLPAAVVVRRRPP